MQSEFDATHGTLELNPGVPHDLQGHLVNEAEICVASVTNMQQCFTDSIHLHMQC